MSSYLALGMQELLTESIIQSTGIRSKTFVIKNFRKLENAIGVPAEIEPYLVADI